MAEGTHRHAPPAATGSAIARRARVGRWLLGVTLLASAMALGSLHTPVLATIAVLAATSMGLLWYDAEPFRARPAATVLLFVGLGLVAYTALQALPLPAHVVAAIAPENADAWARALAPMHEPGPRFVTLSLDPTATRVQFLRGVTYLLVFVAALRVAHQGEGVSFLERSLVASGVAMAAAALLHPVFGAQRVFGTYEPLDRWAYAPTHMAPLLNSNHLAGYVNIGLFVALAATLRRRSSIPRPIAIVATLVLVATNFWAASRGGTGSMVFGVVVTFAVVVLIRRTERARSLTRFLPLSVSVAAILMIGLLSADHARSELGSTDLSKLELFSMTSRLVPKFSLFGVGRGAFESAFPSVRDGTDYHVWTHPENVVLQWATEWGVVAAVVAIGVIVWALRPRTMLTRSQPPVGAWVAIVVLALHNLVDFSTEVPGVMIALAVCAAIVVGGTGGAAPTSRASAWSTRPERLVLAGTAAVAMAVAVTVPWTSVELDAERRAFHKLVIGRKMPPAEFREHLKDAMLRHPAEAYFPFLGALHASMERTESPIPWIAHTLERSPIYGRAHLLLARALYRVNPSQARLEYRLAADQEQNLTRLAAEEALPLVTGYDDAVELVPASRRGVPMREVLANALTNRLPATAARLDRELLVLEPRSLGAQRRVVNAAILDLQNEESWCLTAKGECFEEGLRAAAQIRSLAPASCEGEVLTAELRVAAGEVEAALSGLERAAEVSIDRGTCLKSIVALSTAAHRTARAEAALDRLTQIGCSTAAQCADNFAFAAQAEIQRGNVRRGFALYKRAAERDPNRDAFLQRVADLASAQGLHGEAFDAYTKLAERDPANPKWASAAREERTKLRTGLAPSVER